MRVHFVPEMAHDKQLTIRVGEDIIQALQSFSRELEKTTGGLKIGLASAARLAMIQTLRAGGHLPEDGDDDPSEEVPVKPKRKGR